MVVVVVAVVVALLVCVCVCATVHVCNCACHLEKVKSHAHTWAQAETWPDVGAHLGPCAAMPAHHVPSCERLNTRPGLGAHVCLGGQGGQGPCRGALPLGCMGPQGACALWPTLVARVGASANKPHVLAWAHLGALGAKLALNCTVCLYPCAHNWVAVAMPAHPWYTEPLCTH